MTKKEELIQEATDCGAEVVNHRFNSERIKGLYSDGMITISDRLETSAQQNSILGEELGHHLTSYGNILDQSDVMNRKQELRAGRIMHCHPDALSNRFKRAVKYTMRHELTEHIRFHDLRHYYASIAHALGVPDVYIMQQGGWKTDNVMKRVYRDALSDRIRPEAEKISSHAEGFFS